jgi:hypothetical protein
MYPDREFMIFPVSELDKIDFNQVLETSPETVRRSVDGLKTFIKWNGEDIPSSVASLVGAEGPYTYDEILQILATPEWTDPNPMGEQI